MKKVVLLVIALFLIAIYNNRTVAPGTGISEEVAVSDLFDLSSMRSYAYIRTGNTTFLSEVDSSSYSGLPAWRIKTSSKYSGSTMYVSKSGNECIYHVAEIIIGGLKNTNNGCPQSLKKLLSNKGHDTVEVPAGTFYSTIYEADGIRYYHSQRAPLPVRIETSSYTLELLDYS